jgi:RNA polymerase sigma factor (sigma-70 family)
MQSTDDSARLRQYVENNSDEAFAALVTRHINLVYSVALRQVGNPASAQEITQAVFIILARKAGQLRNDKALSSWLFKTTQLTANNFLRSEMRRQSREQEAHDMQTILNEPETDLWPKIAPLLDNAVAALNEKDRRAILLRFYEGKNLREIGNLLGSNEPAAEKRVSRALEKLRKFFTKRGVSSTTAIIAGTISANSVQAAPVTLAKAVTAVAIAKGAAASASTLTLIKGALKIMAWTKAKTAIVAGTVVLLAAGTSIVTIKQIQKEKHRSHTPQEQASAFDLVMSGSDTKWADGSVLHVSKCDGTSIQGVQIKQTFQGGEIRIITADTGTIQKIGKSTIFITLNDAKLLFGNGSVTNFPGKFFVELYR